MYYLLSLPSPVDSFLVVNEIHGPSDSHGGSPGDEFFTQLALIETARSTERARQRRTADLWSTSCPSLATLSASADDTAKLTVETEI
jgi:hypothetical protein